MEPYRPELAILGAGSVVQARHLPALLAVGGRPATIFDPSSSAAEKAAHAFGIARVASSAEDAIADKRVGAVLVASPNAFHREQTEFALGSGRHVLCEKPIALSLSDADAMAKAAQRAGLILQVGFHHRFSAEHRCAKRLVDAGILGEALAYSGTISEPFDVIPGGTQNYRLNARQGGGLTLIDVGQHRLDQIRDLLGDYAAVSCEMASVLEQHNKDDSVALALRMTSGALGSMSWHRFSRAFVSPLHLFGTKAALGCSAFITAPYQSAPVSVYLEDDPASVLPSEVLAWTRPSRWWGDVESGWVDIWPPRIRTFEAQFRNFFAAIEGKERPMADGDDGYRALELVQAAYQSFAEKRSVAVPLHDNAPRDPPTW